MHEIVAAAKALSDPSRVRALLALRHGELCVCQLTALLELAPSTASKHLSVLRQAGLVLSRRQQQWMHYRLPGADTSLPVRRMIALVTDCLAGSDQVRSDDTRLKSIRRMRAADLCRPRRGRA